MLKSDSTSGYQDLLALTVWDDNDQEYSIKALLEKILELETTIAGYKKELERTNKKLEEYSKVNDGTEALIAKSTSLLSKKVVQNRKDIEELQQKCKYL